MFAAEGSVQAATVGAVEGVALTPRATHNDSLIRNKARDRPSSATRVSCAMGRRSLENTPTNRCGRGCKPQPGAGREIAVRADVRPRAMVSPSPAERGRGPLRRRGTVIGAQFSPLRAQFARGGVGGGARKRANRGCLLGEAPRPHDHLPFAPATIPRPAGRRAAAEPGAFLAVPCAPPVPCARPERTRKHA